MNLALNQATCRENPLIEFIEFAQDFNSIELNFIQISESLTEQFTLKDLFEQLEMYNLSVYALFELEDFSLCSDTKFKTEIIPTLHKMMEYCYKLECDLITITPSFERRDISQWRIERRTIKRLEALGTIAYKEDIRIGCEFVNLPDSSIPTLSEAKKILTPSYSLENVGYVIDTYYLAKGGENFEDIDQISNNLYLIRLADLLSHEKEPKKESDEEIRVLPGMGVFNFKDFFQIVERFYKYSYSLKIMKRFCGKDLHTRFYQSLKNYYRDKK